jgi:hypothetical protein
LREQYDSQSNIATSTANHEDIQRFRLRLNADFKLAGGWFGGVQLQTNNASDSANQTFGPAYSNYGIYISRAFFGWQNDWFTAIGGKQPNPFYTTDLVWDPDINPDGISESLSIDKLFAGSSVEQAAGYSKDGKAVTTSGTKAEYPWSLTLIAGQFVYQDNKDNGVVQDSDSAKTNAWQFVEQLVGTYKVTPDLKFTLAPGFSTYTSGVVTGATDKQPLNNATLTGRDPAVTRDLDVITAPGDVAFNVFGLKTKVLWDFAYNADARDRFTQVLAIPEAEQRGKDSRSWLAGLALGENQKTGDWSVFANYRQVGIASIDPNLNDSDFALSYMDVEGYKLGVAYNVTDFTIAAITWYNAYSMGGLRGGDATTVPGSIFTANLANASAVQVLQLDFNIKF